MKEFCFQLHSHTDYVHAFGRHFRTAVTNNTFHLPEHAGTGWIKARPLANRMMLLIYDYTLEEHLATQRLPHHNRYFYLTLHQCEGEAGNMVNLSRNWPKHQILEGNNVSLEHCHHPSRRIIPARIKHKGIQLLFEPKHLEPFFSEDQVTWMLNGFFLEGEKPMISEPLNGEYRKSMEAYFSSNNTGTLAQIQQENIAYQLLELFLTSQLGKEEQKPLNLHADEVQRLMKVEALLVKDYSKSAPTIDELARIANISATKLKKDFKTLYGHPIFEYYQRHRMQRAKELLLMNEYSIKGVGIMVGYSNLGHFAAAFKKEFGILPSALGLKSAGLESVSMVNE